MARQNTVIQVFVASPGDVKEERAILETVVIQLNQIWSKNLGLTFELLRWETTVHPAFSSDPQAAINEQIGLDYDVFIGIFWGRLGTATPRATSGTLEEFEHAYSRLSATGLTPEIMLYFKDAPIAPSRLDPDQLKGVQDFKRSLSGRGGLYSDFEDVAGFESSVRAHLSAVAQKFAKPNTTLVNPPAIPAPQSVVEDEEELGYLDHVEIYQAKMDEMTMILGLINGATVRIGEQVSQHSSELEKNGNSNPKAVRRFISRAADDMENYAVIMQNQVPSLSAARIIALNALSSALSLRGDFANSDNDDLLVLRASLTSLNDGAGTARSAMAGMRNATDGVPRMSKEIIKAKRVVVSQIDALLHEIDSTQSTVENIVEAIDRMLEGPTSRVGASKV